MHFMDAPDWSKKTESMPVDVFHVALNQFQKQIDKQLDKKQVVFITGFKNKECEIPSCDRDRVHTSLEISFEVEADS